MRTITILLLSLLSIATTYADDFKLHSRRITTDNGLPGNTINEIVQDADGYIWMATNNGLSRYDGYATVNYSSVACDDQHHLEARIGRIYLDTPNNLLWLSTATYQNACYDLKQARFTDWTGRGDSYRQMNKLMMTRRGTVFYGNGLGARISRKVGDGEFTSFDYTKQDGSLPNDNILTVVEDSAGNIWMPTASGIALILASQEIGKTKPRLFNLSKGNIIAAVAGKEAWFLNSEGEVFTGQGQRVTRTAVVPAMLGRPQKVNTSFVWQGQWMLFTPEGTLAMDLRTGVFSKPGQWQIQNGLNQGTCEGYHFIGTRDGRLWIFPEQGTPRRLDLIPATRYSTSKGWLFHTAKDRQGRLFIATYGAGLYVYCPQTGATTHYSANDPSPLIDSDYLLTAMTDRSGCVWLGSEMGGAYCLTMVNSGTANYIMPNPASRGDLTNTVNSLSMHDDGKLLLGMRNGNIYAMTIPYTPKSVLTTVDRKQTNIMAQLTDSRNRRWTGTWGGGLYCDGLLFSANDSAHYIASNFISDIKEDRQGHIWIATWNSGIMKTVGDSIVQVMGGNMNRSRVSHIDIAPDGTVWAATNDGVCQISKEGQLTQYNTSNGLFANDEINAILVEKPNTLWVATAGNGIVKCEITAKGTLRIADTYATDRGLACNNATAVARDKDGNIWVGTENGLSRIVPDANIINTYQFAETPQGNTVSKHCMLVAADGHLYVGTGDGLLVVNPAHIKTSSRRQLAITNVSINGESFLSNRPSTLSHDQDNLTFYFSCFEYSNQQKPIFQYYLEGLERDWQQTTNMNQAVYRNLLPGRYTFHVRTLAENGQWQQEATYRFTINQPWYNQWWAWLVYGLLLALLGWYVARNWRERFKLHQQMKIERQVNEFRVNLFTDITHEFRTPLAIIKGAVDKLQQDASNKAAQQSMQRATNRMLRMVNQFLELRKISTGHLRLQVEQADIVVFVRDMVQDLWGMAKQKDQQLTFTPFSKHHSMPFDKHMVESIVYNLLSNAIKYTPERGNISVTLREEDEGIALCVEDNGPGISDKQQAGLFKPFVHGYVSHGGMGIGLYTAYQMAVAHKGSLTYQRTSQEGGSLFRLLLPANADAYTADDYMEDSTHAVQQKSEEHEEETRIIREMQGEALNNLNVVVIEDDPDIMQQICSEIGVYFNTTGYATGEAGYNSILAAPPSLLICDVMLPDINGYEIIERMKADSKTSAIPIIMLTALNDEVHQIRAYKAGADDYMVKPCNFRLLVAKAMQLIKWRSTEPQASDAADPLIENRVDKIFLEKLEKLTYQHLSEETLNVDRLAEMMSMGRTKFYGKVKELTSMSPNRYIQEKRMTRAAELLLEGEMTVSEICYKIGMQDPSYFNKVFKSRFGVVPSKYGK